MLMIFFRKSKSKLSTSLYFSWTAWMVGRSAPSRMAVSTSCSSYSSTPLMSAPSAVRRTASRTAVPTMVLRAAVVPSFAPMMCWLIVLRRSASSLASWVVVMVGGVAGDWFGLAVARSSAIFFALASTFAPVSKSFERTWLVGFSLSSKSFFMPFPGSRMLIMVAS